MAWGSQLEVVRNRRLITRRSVRTGTHARDELEEMGSGLLRSARSRRRRAPPSVTAGMDMSVDGRDRAAEVGGDLAQAIARARWARSRHKDATETRGWNEEDLTRIYGVALLGPIDPAGEYRPFQPRPVCTLDYVNCVQ